MGGTNILIKMTNKFNPVATKFPRRKKLPESPARGALSLASHELLLKMVVLGHTLLD
jgi:hypothetical protein